MLAGVIGISCRNESLLYARALRETTDDPNALGGIFVAPLLKGSQIRTVPLPDCARREPRRVARTRTRSIEKSCWASGNLEIIPNQVSFEKVEPHGSKIGRHCNGCFYPCARKALEVILTDRLHLDWRRPDAAEF